ncbi:MAG: hypothetical protein HY674_07580 [Chloroflexi bacterium]|nr:hypothetical protein [Chloroflexota bacterium]
MNKAPQQWNCTQLWTAIVVSAICLLIVIARHIWPAVIVLDQATLGLLALAALPWLTLFFKKFKIPGIGEAETQERAQGTTQKPLPPRTEVQLTSESVPLSPDTMKVLATLWRYQRQSFGNDTMKRWTFTVHPVARDYPRFLAGLTGAVNRGWVAVSPETHQCMLTNEGLAYIEGNADLQKYGEIYKF